jgi:hypothetical protein
MARGSSGGQAVMRSGPRAAPGCRTSSEPVNERKQAVRKAVKIGEHWWCLPGQTRGRRGQGQEV